MICDICKKNIIDHELVFKLVPCSNNGNELIYNFEEKDFIIHFNCFNKETAEEIKESVVGRNNILIDIL